MKKNITSYSPNIILNDINLIVIVTNASGKLVYVSPATEKLLGFSNEELINEWWEKTYKSEIESQTVKEKIQQTLKGTIKVNNQSYDRQVLCKNGSNKWIEWRDSIGSDNTYISLGIDVTEWKRKEEQNLQNEVILKNINSIILVSSKDGEVIYVSPSVIKILGYSNKELIGNNWWLKTYESTGKAAQIKDAIITELFSTEPVYTNTNRQKIKTKSGSYKWIEWARSKSLNDTFISIGTDVTSRILSEIELNKAKEAAEQSLKVKNEFLANMSHEIRTPLNGIIGFTDLLLETEITEEQRKYLKTMNNSGEILLSIINDVLDLSKLESQKLEAEEIPFNLHLQIEKIVNLMDVKAGHKHIQLNLEIHKDTPKFIKSDPTKIGQILLNLIGNAVKFTNHGSVTIKAFLNEKAANGPNICFEIIDTGIGIVPNKINTVFGAFNQAKSDTSRIYGGTGLGLTIVKKLVDLLKGQITVSSIFGSGTNFKLSLPIKIEKSQIETPNVPAPIVKFEALNYNILLVEDNKTNQLLAKTRLESWKCNVDIAENGFEGVKKAEKKIYDIILMDVQMPVMDGYEATKIIKNDLSEEVSKTPILGMSAYTASSETEKMLNSGMENFIFKPFKPTDLYQMLVKYAKK
ncbi:PAS domain-containing hybrid sensor histidine kinase/response regulator [Lutibacter citreus]|uniref:PAS domain-containing hybrid sensor histidine kinase/response regulator n=1 Tax=Lutibacter citreus TaxID=2138210 RepID=UPI000DBE323A|nr:PAS domain S-box protein [Lutibacter citreus]